MPDNTAHAAAAEGAPSSPQAPPRGALAPLAPLPQRPTLEPIPVGPGRSPLAKPPLPSLVPPLPSSPQPSAPAGAAAEQPATDAPREPASIAGLGSPATAAEPVTAATAAPRPPSRRPSHSTPPAGAPPAPPPTQQQQVSRPPSRQASTSKRVAPAPLAAPPPTLLESPPAAEPPAALAALPGLVPSTPTAEGQVQGAPNRGQNAPSPAAAAAGSTTANGAAAARAAKREPPKEPPPPAAVDHVAVTTDSRTVEQYIPFGFLELRGKVLADYPAVFSDPEVARKFVEVCKWISLRNTLRLEIDYGDAEEKYAPLDPDKDTLAFKAAAAAGADAAAGKGPIVPKKDMKAMVSNLYGELDRIFDKAEFSELPPEDLENAKHHKSLMGLEVIPVSDEVLEYRIHYRGTRLKKIQFRRWGLFKRQIEMNVYERLAISFRLKKPVNKDDLPEDSGSLGVDTRPWYKRLFCARRVSASPALAELRDEFVYMKLFKDVLQSDVDMLLPGAVIKFTWFDYAVVWVPILFGCGMAIWKAASGTIDFSTLVNAALSIVLIVMPITWGVRAYFAVKEKQRLHQAHLNALYLLHNLNNNAGVISQLLDEAQEQEDNEAMLAYFFLWQGQASPQPIPKLELDRAVEAYLQSKLDELKVPIRIDFEVLDGMTKLDRLGLVHITRGEDGNRRLQALPLDLALEKAHVRFFDETRETGQPELPPTEARRQGSIGLAWHECADIFRPTGQKFRYFWNANTGESQYQEPDEPYIKLGASAALDLEDAHGVNMSDPNKQPTLQQHAKTA